MNMEQKNEKIQKLKKIIRGKTLFSFEGPGGVVMSDGDPKKNWKFNLRQICLDSEFLNLVAELFWEKFGDGYPFQIGGQELAAVPIMAAISLHGTKIGKPVNGFIIRKARKISRSQKMIEGEISNEKIILVDDAVSTGTTMIHGLKVVEQAGKTVHKFFSVIECGGNQSSELFRKHNIKYEYFYNLDDFNLKLAKKETIKSDFKEIWCFRSPNPNYFHVIPKSAPAIDEKNLYFGSDSGFFWALDQNDGSIRWKFQVGYPTPSGKSIFSSPAIDEKNVYFGSYDGNVYALEKFSGKLKWKYQNADWIGSSPSLAPDLELLFIGLEFGLFRKKGGLAAIDMESGEKVWNFLMPEYVHGSPAYCAEKRVVAVGGNDDYAYLFDAKNGELKWKFETGGDIKASLKFAPEKNLVIFGSCDNNIYLLDIDSGELKGKFETRDAVYSTPKIHKKNIYFTSTDKQLYSLNLDTGKLNWRFTANGRIFSSPEIVGGKVLFGANDGVLYEVDIESGQCESIFQTAERITNKIAYNPKTKRYFLPTYANEIYCLKKNIPEAASP